MRLLRDAIAGAPRKPRQGPPAVIGVLLAGRLKDGTAGLQEIKRLAGTSMVRDPAEAEAPPMPAHALGHVAIDHCLPLAAIPPMLVRPVLVPAAGADEHRLRRRLRSPFRPAPDRCRP